MRVHRGHLFWGVSLVVLGAVPLADRAGWIDAQSFEVWRLWPLALIAVGIAIIVSRTRLAVLGVVFAGVVAGGIAGTAVTYGGFAFGFADCAPGGELERVTDGGTLAAPARVELAFNCGSVEVELGAGDTWELDAAYRGAAPIAESTGDRLVVRAPDAAGRQEWRLSLPASMRELDVQANAAETTIDVSGADLLALTAHANAGQLRMVAEDATLVDLDVSANAGSVVMVLSGDTSGSVSANAGSIDVCVPDDAALRIEVEEQFAFGTNLDGQGLERVGDTWQRSGTGPTIELRVEGNAASFNLNSAGSCR
ncbi:MAG: LiaI-LiaF-like domain-containing protein [Candidatus Limnocylindria bacterium]